MYLFITISLPHEQVLIHDSILFLTLLIFDFPSIHLWEALTKAFLWKSK